MKTQTLVKLLSVVLVCTIVAGSSFGQARGSASIPLKIRKFNAIGSRSRVVTPQYNSDVSRGSGAAKEWHAISVSYETSPEWLDELTVEFHVLSKTRDFETKKNVYALYKLVVRYMDIERGREHMATAYLRPSALKRFGEPIAVAAIFSVGGVVVDTANETTEKMPEKWWKDPRVTDRDGVTSRSGYLLNRSESPWAMINIDDFEVIK